MWTAATVDVEVVEGEVAVLVGLSCLLNGLELSLWPLSIAEPEEQAAEDTAEVDVRPDVILAVEEPTEVTEAKDRLEGATARAFEAAAACLMA